MCVAVALKIRLKFIGSPNRNLLTCVSARVGSVVSCFIVVNVRGLNVFWVMEYLRSHVCFGRKLKL